MTNRPKKNRITSNGLLIAPGKLVDISPDAVQRMYEEGQSQGTIAQCLGVSQTGIGKFMKRHGIKARSHQVIMTNIYRFQFRGEFNPRWNGGKSQTLDGYKLLRAWGHPRADNRGYVREHILVWERAVSRYLPEGWEIHHLNGVKDDNRPENLLALEGHKHKNLIGAYKQRIRQLELELEACRVAKGDEHE